MGSAAFRLTAAGWLRAMLLSGTADTTDCRERCARLAQALKSVVKGRNSHYDGLTTEHEIASTAHLPVGWVFNALKSRLLGVVFPKDRWDATIDKRTIRVKPSFSNRVRRRRTVLGSTSIHSAMLAFDGCGRLSEYHQCLARWSRMFTSTASRPSARFFEEFCRESAREMNRLRMEQRAGVSGAKRELERVRREIQKVIEAIVDGVKGSELKDRLADLQNRKDALLKQLEVADEPPPLLHPSMADLYRSKVEQLAAALQREDTRLEASEMLRGLIDSIVLTPEKGQLRIELRGNLAAMLTTAQQTKRSPESGDLIVPVQMVAGARSRQYRPLCTLSRPEPVARLTLLSMMINRGSQLVSFVPMSASGRRHLKRLRQLDCGSQSFVTNAVLWIPSLGCVLVAVQIAPYDHLVATLCERQKPTPWNSRARRRLILREAGDVHEDGAPAPLDV